MSQRINAFRNTLEESQNEIDSSPRAPQISFKAAQESARALAGVTVGLFFSVGLGTGGGISVLALAQVILLLCKCCPYIQLENSLKTYSKLMYKRLVKTKPNQVSEQNTFFHNRFLLKMDCRRRTLLILVRMTKTT